MSKSPIKNYWKSLNNSQLVHYLLLFALGWAITQVLTYFANVFIIFTFAAILAFLLNYPVQFFQRFLPHGIAVSVVFILSLLILGSLTLTVGLATLSQGKQLLNQSNELVNSVIPLLNRLEEFLRNRNVQVEFVAIEEQLRNQALAGLGVGLATLQTWFSNFIDLVLISVVALFMLLDGERLWHFILNFFPKALRHKLTITIQRSLLGFFWGRFLLSLFFGVSAFIVFLILQVPYPLVLAAVAGIFDLIPGIGATIGISLVALILLPQGIWLSLKVLVGCIVLQQIEENLLMPRIMQGSINLNPVIMFFALLVGARIAGLLGIFLAIPIAGVFVSLLEIEEMKGE